MRATLYLAVLTAIFLGIGYLIGGNDGMVSAFIFALIMNFGNYWFSSKIVLTIYGAIPMKREEYPAIYAMIEDLAQRASLPMPTLYLIPTETPNAFATGRDENHAVVGITQGILRLLSEDELRGVLAHELSHIKNKDMLVSAMAATLAGAIAMLGRIAFWFGGNDENRSGIVGMLIMVIITPLIAMLIQLAVSRSREYGADSSGRQLLGGDGSTLASALGKLGQFTKRFPAQGTPSQEAAAHLFIINPFKASGLTHLFSTHPPMEERIRRLLA
ncbi:zinc metalloprotease HtpX [Candidatus Uhrbacteria bacterium]|nr:zinc metalloprotease HtpX [Candidatus Uhrbacteria bacterium]